MLNNNMFQTKEEDKRGITREKWFMGSKTWRIEKLIRSKECRETWEMINKSK